MDRMGIVNYNPYTPFEQGMTERRWKEYKQNLKEDRIKRSEGSSITREWDEDNFHCIKYADGTIRRIAK